MRTRNNIVSLAGIVLVLVAAYRVPYVSPYASVLIGAGLAIALVWATAGAPVVELGLSPPRCIGRTLAIGIVAGVALVLVSRLMLTPLIERLTGIRRDLSAVEYLHGNGRAVLALLPAVWLSAGICEEVVYRGYLISQLAKLCGNSREALLASTALAAIGFGLAHWHQGLTGMLVTGSLGLLFGLLFLQQSRNLWVNMIAHIVADTVSLSLIGLNWDGWLDALGRGLVG